MVYLKCVLYFRANTGPITGTSYTVKNLPTGKEFQFRIIPVNLAGEGEPSEPTENVKVQNPPSMDCFFSSCPLYPVLISFFNST